MNEQERKKIHQEDNLFRCRNCNTIVAKLPLYIYPPKGRAVLMGWVCKCLDCQENYDFIWTREPNRYSSERIRQMLIQANQGRYTRGFTEAEICSPTPFKVREDDDDFLSYQRRFETLLKQYAR